MTTASATPEFSLEAFRELFENSLAKKYIPKAEIDRVYKGLEQKDVSLLKPLYAILLQAKATDSGIVHDFAVEQKKIMGDFTAEAHAIDRYYAAEPGRKMAAAAEEREKFAAEKLLKKLK